MRSLDRTIDLPRHDLMTGFLVGFRCLDRKVYSGTPDMDKLGNRMDTFCRKTRLFATQSATVHVTHHDSGNPPSIHKLMHGMFIYFPDIANICKCDKTQNSGVIENHGNTFHPLVEPNYASRMIFERIDAFCIKLFQDPILVTFVFFS